MPADDSSAWVWWNTIGGAFNVGPKDKGAMAVVFTLEEAQAICKAVNGRSYQQVGWAKLGTWSGELYVQEYRRVDEGQNERHFHPIFISTKKD